MNGLGVKAPGCREISIGVVLFASFSAGQACTSEHDESILWRTEALSDQGLVIHEVHHHEADFVHPLIGLERDSDGLIPFVDTQDTPDGRRYGVEVGGQEHEEGDFRKTNRVVAWPVRTLSDSDEEEYQAAKTTGGMQAPEYVVNAAAKVGATLRDTLLAAAPDDQLDIVVRFAEPKDLSIADKLTLAMARGEIVTEEDFERHRASLKAERRERITRLASVMRPAFESVGRVHAVYENIYCLSATVPASAINAMAAWDEVARVDLEDEFRGGAITGTPEVSPHFQSTPYRSRMNSCSRSTCS